MGGHNAETFVKPEKFHKRLLLGIFEITSCTFFWPRSPRLAAPLQTVLKESLALLGSSVLGSDPSFRQAAGGVSALTPLSDWTGRCFLGTPRVSVLNSLKIHSFLQEPRCPLRIMDVCLGVKQHIG